MRLLVILLLARCSGTKDKRGDNNQIKEDQDRTYRAPNQTKGTSPIELYLYVLKALNPHINQAADGVPVEFVKIRFNQCFF